jgi:hypothetical protein
LTRTARVVAILGIAALATLLPAAPGLANGGLLRGLDEDLYGSPDPAIRDTWFERTVEAGARVVRVGVSWGEVARSEPVDPSNPADPAYDFGRLDEVVSDARSRGLEVMLTAFAGPEWAEGQNAPAGVKAGTWKPDPAAFGEFGEALGRRYSGQFVGLSGPLPDVAYFEAWNEANLADSLAPQWEGNRPVAPRHYRLLLNAFYDGVKAAHPSARVVAGATAPYGDSEKRPDSRMRPLRFLRELLCLERHGVMDCPIRPELDILSHHPINLSGPPEQKAFNRDDATIADFKRVRRLLKRAERAETVLPAGERGRPAWASEIWLQSDPPGGFGSVPLRKHAQWIQRSLYLLWKQDAAAVIYYQLTDGGSSQGADPAAGLYFADGRRKPAYTAYRFPFVAEAGKGRERAWTIPPISGKLEIESRKNGGWRREKSLQVEAGVPEDTRIRIGAKDKARAVIAGESSLSSRPGP